ncbi:hypothetical protein DYU05_06045 [Mucilaginibacter terrenus]|uniref:TonB-dependent receptor n=1 Tax=Mucilaginibacter terrenus TaxID=2482727 RepID=A0A3E2NW16_9SPHI|nr:hypothetical protein [Mucilaginibacter terrenus]RFZ85159.1 hypothetical protein DYU05_06045 [Mucilaginibacter terrenus]
MRFLLIQILLLTATTAKVSAQNTSFSEMVNTQAKNREKIYIHFNQDRYFKGDTVWFKAYLFTDGRPSNTSKNFYLELLNSSGQVSSRFTAPIIASTSSGFAVISANDGDLVTQCRAYTVATLNGDTSLLYKKTLQILNRVQSSDAKIHVNASAKFLPEGGNWVAGLPTVLAFKITGDNEFPLEAEGRIKDQNGKDVAEFATVHDGMGSCTIIPRNNYSYTAIWQTKDGQHHSTKLPPVLEQGVVLQVSAASNSRKVALFRTNQVGEEDRTLSLLAVLNGTVVYQSIVHLEHETSARITIPTAGLPTGILYLTVFNSKQQPLTERISFVNNDNYGFEVKALPESLRKEKRSRNKITLFKPDSLRANLSISVTDAEFADGSSDADNIITHLLLTGDLHGKIYQPGYYFRNREDSTIRNLDLVMLTNGWRKYKWTAAPLPQNPLIESEYLTISGKLQDAFKGTSSKEAAINGIITPADGESALLDFSETKNGGFYKAGVIFYGEGSVMFKFSSNRNRTATVLPIELSNGLLPSYPFKINAAAEILKMTAFERKDTLPPKYDLLHSGPRNHVLDEVVIKGTASTNMEALDKKYTQGLFRGGISRNIDLGSDPKSINYLSFFQYLQMNIPGLQISGATSLAPGITWRKAPVKFYLNNNESSPADIRALPMAEMDYVKIYDPSQGGIFQSEGGVIAVYSKGGRGIRNSADNSPRSKITGYSPVKEFYMPEPATELTAANDVVDNRSTLLWKPNVLFDEKTHKLELPFFYNGFTKKLKIVLEGINAAGKMVHFERVY